MTESDTELLTRIAEVQIAQAERMKDVFKGWSDAMLQARMDILDAWHVIEQGTWGEANYKPEVYGAAPYLDNDEGLAGLDNIWDIERELNRRNREKDA